MILGNHHDAWVYGAADPGSGTASLLEVARCLGQLAQEGYRPKRTIVFASWDAEEFGILGSTEWVEDLKAELQRKAIAYLNVDTATTGTEFYASAVPSLKALVKEVAKLLRIHRPIKQFMRRGGSIKTTMSRGLVISAAVPTIPPLLDISAFRPSAWDFMGPTVSITLCRTPSIGWSVSVIQRFGITWR